MSTESKVREQATETEVEFNIEILPDGKINIRKDGNLLVPIHEEKLPGYFDKHPIREVIITPMFTYFKTGSGTIVINGVAYEVP